MIMMMLMSIMIMMKIVQKNINTNYTLEFNWAIPSISILFHKSVTMSSYQLQRHVYKKQSRLHPIDYNG